MVMLVASSYGKIEVLLNKRIYRYLIQVHDVKDCNEYTQTKFKKNSCRWRSFHKFIAIRIPYPARVVACPYTDLWSNQDTTQG